MMGEPNAKQPNVDDLIDQAIEEAPPQVLLSTPDAPLARSAELLAAIQGSALRAVLEARLERMLKHGHDAETDAMLPIGQLPRLARDTAAMAIDTLGSDDRRDIKVARRRLARAAAICMAAIDRLDMIKEGSAGR